MGRFKNIWDAALGKQEPVVTTPITNEPQASLGSYTSLFAISYNGEKNLGEIGPIRDYKLDYEALRMRSWQSYLESEISQTVIKKFALWVVGSGLKLQSNPVEAVFKSENIKIDVEAFNEVAESRFTLFAGSEMSDFSGMENLNLIANTAFINSIIGGDCVVILRYVDNCVKVQLIDGSHLCSPKFGSDSYAEALKNGNEIRHGIELSPTGEHVAYFIKKGLFGSERILAKGKSGLTMAYLVYGLKYRLDNKRGIPLIATVLETLKKLERYKEATIGSAEERQKIPYSIEHQEFSTGENPLEKVIVKAFDADAKTGDIPIDVQGNQLADTIAVTTNKQVFNMPKGSVLKSLDSKNELAFKDFYTTNINLVCASIGIPPEVALSKYDSNFSASRAALKDWEHTINANRIRFSFQFYRNIYKLWLETEILKNKIDAPGYLTAKAEKNLMVMESYWNARFTGPSVPHIDPLKEVEAERLKLGDSATAIPLTTVEAATEALNGGDSDSNIAQYAEELKESKTLGIESPNPEIPKIKPKGKPAED